MKSGRRGQRKSALLKDIKLPRSVGKLKLDEHPLLIALRGTTVRKLAEEIGVDFSTLFPYARNAREDRDTLVPAHYVLKLAAATGIPPYAWRPDLYPKEGIKGVK